MQLLIAYILRCIYCKYGRINSSSILLVRQFSNFLQQYLDQFLGWGTFAAILKSCKIVGAALESCKIVGAALKSCKIVGTDWRTHGGASIECWLESQHLFDGGIFWKVHLEAAEIQPRWDDLHVWHVSAKSPSAPQNFLQLAVIPVANQMKWLQSAHERDAQTGCVCHDDNAASCTSICRGLTGCLENRCAQVC